MAPASKRPVHGPKCSQSGEDSCARSPTIKFAIARRFAALACALAAACGASAADYPNRAVTLVVPYPPGGGVDAMARVVAAKLSDAFKQQVIVDNAAAPAAPSAPARSPAPRPTATRCCSATPAPSRSIPASTRNPGYDPRKDFAPIGLVASMPVALLANPSFPAKSVADFIALAKKEPGKLNLGTSAIGTGGYMCAELFKSVAGVDVAIIPYKGTAPVMNDLLGGHVPVAFGVLPPALGNIQAGKLRAIAVTSAKRFSLLPEVPTFDESGLPGFEAVLHYGLLAPAGTPKEIVDKLSAELRKLVDTDDVKQRIHFEGGDPLTSTPAEYAADIDKEEKKWGALVRKLNLKVE